MEKDDEVKIILSFLFKRSGKQELKEAELYLPLSLELKWFSSSQANQIVQYALHKNFLEKINGLVTPTFDINTVTIPVGFEPTHTSFIVSSQKSIEKSSDPSSDGLVDLHQQILKTKENLDETSLKKAIQHLSTTKGITPSVATLLYAYQNQIEIDAFVQQIETTLTPKNEE